MCEGCYDRYGSPQIISDKTIAAAELVRQVYEFSFVGGRLHVQLDDWNLDDEFFEDDDLDPDHWVGPASLETERKCYAAFKAMTLEERASALALADGYLEAA